MQKSHGIRFCEFELEDLPITAMNCLQNEEEDQVELSNLTDNQEAENRNTQPNSHFQRQTSSDSWTTLSSLQAIGSVIYNMECAVMTTITSLMTIKPLFIQRSSQRILSQRWSNERNNFPLVRQDNFYSSS